MRADLGAELFEQRMEETADSEECYSVSEGKTNWEICPMKTATAWDGDELVYEMQFSGVAETGDGSVDMNFDDGLDCSIKLRVVCSKTGDMVVDSLGDLLKTDTCEHLGWFNTPMACSATPSKFNWSLCQTSSMKQLFGFQCRELELVPVPLVFYTPPPTPPRAHCLFDGYPHLRHIIGCYFFLFKSEGCCIFIQLNQKNVPPKVKKLLFLKDKIGCKLLRVAKIYRRIILLNTKLYSLLKKKLAVFITP